MQKIIEDFIIAPLSFAQERLWTLEQMSLNNNGAYHLQQCLQLNGLLDNIILEKSFKALIDRHQALRTNFIFYNDEPMQLVKDDIPFSIQYHDLQEPPINSRHEILKVLVKNEGEKSFNLSTDNLMRVHLLKFSPENHILIIILHHIIIDGWSLKILCRDLVAFYEAFIRKTEIVLPPLPTQYTDFAIRQRQLSANGAFQNQLEYWVNNLNDSPTLELPVDNARSSTLTSNGGEVKIIIPELLVNAIRDLSKKEKVTPFMIFLASFYLLLNKYTGQKDLVVGTPVANRNTADIENLIGFFVNTLVLRIDFNQLNTAHDILLEVKNLVLGAQNNQDISFEKLVEVLKPGRDLNQNPLFQVMLSMQETPITEFTMENLVINLIDIGAEKSQFDITLTMHRTKNGFSGVIQYDNELFEKESIERFADYYQRALQVLINNLDTNITNISLLSPEEEERMVVKWNSSYHDTECIIPILTLLERQIRKNNYNIAINSERQKLTYSQLDYLTDNIASKLRNMGVGPEIPVAVCLERGIESVLALLGIIKANGCFVPLDPNYPSKRFNFILDQTKAVVLITKAKSLKRFVSNIPVILLDEIDMEAHPLQTTLKATSLHPYNTAYVIYTSGSTGTPKGVSVSYQAISRKCQALIQRYEIIENDRIIQFSSPIFDVFLEEILTAIISGAELFISNQIASNSIQGFVNIIQSNDITVANLPSPFWHEWVNELISKDDYIPKSLRLVIVGSQQILPHKLSRWLECTGDRVVLMNAYGTTESVITSTVFQPQAKEKFTNHVPIGRPLDDTTLYALDKHMNSVPIGCDGELYIGGTSLASGYLSRPDLTAEHFVPDPFSFKKGMRLYKTGDFVRYLSNGNVIYVRRLDQQIKIRGFRVEIIEIENVIASLTEIKEVVVKHFPEHGGLVAYVVTKNDSPISPPAIKMQLAKQVPSYMIPNNITKLAQIPKTITGKVDYKSISPPDKMMEKDTTLSNDIERAIASIWIEVLNLETVGRNENFFDLGGDSLLSIRVAAKANKKGLTIAPQQLFHYQTIEEIAAHIGIAQVSLSKTNAFQQIPLTHTQKKFFERVSVHTHHSNRSIVLDSVNDINLIALNKAALFVLQQHAGLSFYFTKDKKGWRQFSGEINQKEDVLIHRDLSQIPSQDQMSELRKAIEHYQQCFDLERGPLIQFVFFTLGSDFSNKLVIIAHTLIADSYSWSIMLDDLLLSYQQICDNGVIQVANKTSEFFEWTQRIQDYANSNEAEDQINTWMQKIATEKPTDLIHENYQALNLESSQDKVHIIFNKQQTFYLLRKLPSLLSVNVNTILLSALGSVCCKLVKGNILVDLGQHGRNILTNGIDVSRTIGNFITECPILLPFMPEEHIINTLDVIYTSLKNLPCLGLGSDLINKVNDLPRPQISFDFISSAVFKGNINFKHNLEIYSKERSYEDMRSHILQVVAANINDELQVEFRYSNVLYKKETIIKLTEDFRDDLLALIAWQL